MGDPRWRTLSAREVYEIYTESRRFGFPLVIDVESTVVEAAHDARYLFLDRAYGNNE